MLHALLLCAAVAAARADTTHLVLVATTDVHGHATEWDYVADRPFPGGLTRAATAIDSLKRRYPGSVIVVDAGDLIEGEPFADYYARVAPRDPHPVIDLMNTLGYDVATPGNHEFDYGLPVLDRAIAAARFRYVSANIRGLPGDTLEYAPYAVVIRNGVRVGITGLTTPGVMVWSRKAVRGRVRVAPIRESAAGVLPAMRRESDLVIAVMHSGMGEPSSYDTTGVGPENASAALAALPTKPDVVIVGHTHREMVDSVLGGVHFVQPKPYAQTLAVVHLDVVRVKTAWRLARVRAESINLAQVSPSPRLAARYQPLRAAVRDWVGQSLGESRGAMPATLARAEPTPIIEFIQAVQKARTGADLSAATAFDTRAGFPDGDVRVRDVFAVYPYENTLRAIRISGAQLKDYLEQSARYYTTDSTGRAGLDPAVFGYNYDMVSGASYDIDLRLPAGSRIRNLTVRDRPVDPNDSFTLALNSYRQSGGGGFTSLRGAPVVYDRDENIRDLLIGEIRARGHLDPADFAAANWRVVPAASADQVRGLFGGAPRTAAPAALRDTVLVRLVALGDFRGSVNQRAAALKVTADRAAAECRCPTLRVAPGDLLQGAPVADLVAGRSAVEVLNRAGLEATALGARDFTWSLDTLRLRMAQSRFPWLAANVMDSATSKRPDWAIPFRVVAVGTVRVALVGYLSPAAQSWLRAAEVPGVSIRPGAAALRDALAAAQAERPDLTVVLADGGATCEGAECQGDAIDLARELQDSKVDLIVTGGDGSVSTRVGRVLVVQARPAAAELGLVDLVRTPVGARELRVRLEPVDPDRVGVDSAAAAIVARAEAEADSLGRRVVARMKLPLGRSTEGESPLGDLVADAQRNALRSDISLVRTAAIGSDLPAGPVTWLELLALHEPPRPLATIVVTGATLRQVLERALSEGVPSVHVSGIVVEYDPGASAGRRVRKVRFDDGRELKDGSSYRLALAEPLTRSPAYPMLSGRAITPSTVTDVDALASYLRRLPQPVSPPEQIRFREVGR
jgi:2',3'-cyclic-nucleotide 2'-phosphodiesterase (5'-nucleotidase family)